MSNKYLVRDKQTGEEVEVSAVSHEQAAKFGAEFFEVDEPLTMELEVTEWDGDTRDFKCIADWRVKRSQYE